jgi:hypothetical protein
MAKLKTKGISGFGLASPMGKSGSNKLPSEQGSGDYYGTGIRNPMGRVRSSYFDMPLSKKALKKPPKSLA